MTDCPHPTPLSKVDITCSFWTGRLEAVRVGALPFIYDQLKRTGRWDCLKLQWKPGDPNKPHRFWDSDMAKWLEAACHSLRVQPDPFLASLVEEAVDMIRGAQQEDGYINSYYTVVEPGRCWTNIAWSHEMYCAGHLLEAALAHHSYTQSTHLLTPVLRYVSHIGSVFGPDEGQNPGYPGHQCLELALLRAYEETDGNEMLLDLATFFIEERGQVHPHGDHYYDIEAKRRNEDPFVGPMRKGGRRFEYFQADLPVREVAIQEDGIQGHSVRAMYWLTAVAHLARLSKDESLHIAAKRLWTSVMERKMYITGGLGAIGEWEGFGPDYYLPNESGYLETCASIGLVFFAHQMLLLEPLESKYAQVLERALYNGVLVGMGLDGRSWFYDNPLAVVEEGLKRSEWFEVACCPPNVARLLTSLEKYIYTFSPDGDTLYVNMYLSSSATITLSCGSVLRITQKSKGPWFGGTSLLIEGAPGEVGKLKVVLRKPEGVRRFDIAIDDTPVMQEQSEYTQVLTCSSFCDVSASRVTVSVQFEYQPRTIHPHPLDLANFRHISLARGPFIYCAESIDNPHIPDLRAIRVDEGSPWEEVVDKESFKRWGVEYVKLRTTVWLECGEEDRRKVELTLIPILLWANRGLSTMRVWLPLA
ncbi:glycoside hydrolase family 127 protein [Jaapia argillacea MUCL 33604]|uniref:Glycoside hydrolase family 127 protein n=1 Tax=Jaapia argillacea MUCL 33604 TaxID=933084 RepID=A0A067PHG5_9AGAM|nr:glycoside hydrolase family 127 protein [Jaapia argillacea MUCL 33604]